MNGAGHASAHLQLGVRRVHHGLDVALLRDVAGNDLDGDA
jgi:hypothetical protein